jgi:Flp pilus assembly protein TadG
MKRMRTSLHSPGRHRQRGAVAVIFGLTLAVLIGFAGLAIDLGRFFVIKSELQNAVDACALAAATQLRPGQNNPNALTKAVAYGRVFSTGGVTDSATGLLEGNIAAIKNRINFQATVIDIAPGQITFSDTPDGLYQPAGSADPNTAAYAKCSFPLDGLPIYFMRVLSPLLTTQTVSAMAVGALAASQSACALPVAVCKASGTSASSNFGLNVGQWLIPPSGPGSTYGTGNFGWIDYTPPGGGASELANMLKGSGQCAVAMADEVGQPGAISSLDVAWNSRFGIYKPGGGNPQADSAPPDFTGYSYTATSWPLGANAYRGSVAGQYNYEDSVANLRPFQANPPNPYNRLSSAEHSTFGRSRRLAVAPVVDCGVWGTSTANPRVEGWACVLMLNPILEKDDNYGLEFLGLSTNPGSPCSTTGEPGAFGPLVPQLVQ